MPTVTTSEVEAYAHCVRPRCPGYEQVPVKGISVEDSFTYAERGGDLPGIENSFVHLRFANEEEAPCPHCKGQRDLSAEPRRQYANLSGHDPDGLLDIEPYDPRKAVGAELEAENAELRERIARLEGFVMASQPEGRAYRAANAGEPTDEK